MTSVLRELKKRQCIEQVSDDNLWEDLASSKRAIYVGFDPTADSLHLGHLVPIMALAHFQRQGHKVIVLVGGATGMVGDPSGKSEERNLLTPDQVKINAAGLKRQLSQFLDFSGENPAVMVDNNDWISKMTFIDWLREVGKFFTINYMLAKESVKKRITSEEGISYTEFSYMTMQAFDFLHLFREYNCTIQGGGNDQWGNITAGIDLVRRVSQARVSGITFPLLTTSTGEKFGKSAGNAVWFDPERTSPYKFYQYLIQTTDEDVDKFLKIFTFLSLEEIENIVNEHHENPGRRLGQQTLASELTKTVHGADGLDRAIVATNAFFGGELEGMTEIDLLDIFDDAPSHTISKARFETDMDLASLLTETGIFESKGAVKRMAKQGGVYLNNQRVIDGTTIITTEHCLTGSIMIVRKGKKDYFVIKIA